jgi:DNA (cytosine-5)-methyltransferase 1
VNDAVDLFAGAGGGTLGLIQAGLQPFGFELADDPIATSQAAGLDVVQCDLRSYRWASELRGVDVLHASPPCQPFSQGGKGRGTDDTRDGTPWTLRAIVALVPRLVTFENVAGLTFPKHRPYLDAFLMQLRVLGYATDWRVINCADLGLPQTRKRVIVVARRDGIAPKWPDPTHAKDGANGLEPWVSMAAGLGWCSSAALNTGMDWKPGEDRATAQQRSLDRPAPAISTKSSGQWHVVAGNDTKATERSIDEPAPTVLACKDPNGWYMTRPATVISADPRVFPPGNHRAYDGRDLSKTIPRSSKDDVIRVPLEDLAVLQGFPRDWPFQGSKTSRARQIGNAVPPVLIHRVVEVNL